MRLITKHTKLAILAIYTMASLLVPATAGTAGTEQDDFVVPDASSLGDQVIIDASCLFDAGSLGHPAPLVACRAEAVRDSAD